MSSFSKTISRIIGLFTLITGVVWLLIAVLEVGKVATVENFIALLFKLVIGCIAVCGGYQLWQTKEIGRKLVIVWLACQMLVIVLASLSFAYLAILKIDFRINTSAQIPLPILIGFYSLCIVALIFLSINRVSKEIPAADNRLLHIMAKGLSLLMPGLGRMLIGNPFAGITLSFVFLSLVGSISYHADSDDLKLFALFINLLYKLVVWSIFSLIDWEFVQNHERAEQARLIPIPNIDSSQVNGS